jgi:hypothetical protein
MVVRFRGDGILAIDVDVRRRHPQRGADPGLSDGRVQAWPASGAPEAFIVPMSGSGWNRTW